jgi:hypothetical protein
VKYSWWGKNEANFLADYLPDHLPNVAIRASALEGVTGHAGALIQHRQLSVRASLKQRQRLVTAGQFVMTPAAIIGGVARCAGSAIECREFAVDVVLPAGGVRLGLHHLMASYALIFRSERGCHVLMASETLRIGCGGIVLVVNPKTLGV